MSAAFFEYRLYHGFQASEEPVAATVVALVTLQLPS
jgi:hypothetical protein